MDESHERPAIEEALRDHRELLKIQNRLGALFTENTCPAFREWIGEVRDELTKLAGLLRPHFVQEEQDGLHDEIAESLPNQSYQLERLLKEHGSLLELLSALCDLALRTELPPGDQELRRQASEFFAALDSHERSERELFLLALEGEGGAPD